jgi:diguanylate cyclase (GGDEF)-like protein/PAS domain S-box-containing protein
MSGLVRLWHRLTEAPTTVIDPGPRRQIRLLSGLLVVLIPLGLLSIGVQLRLIPGFWPTFAAVASALVVLLFAYGLARAGKFTAGAVITISAAALASFAVVILNPHDLFEYAFLLIAILLAALLFSEIGTWVTAVGVLLGASVLLPAWGIPPPDNDPLVVPIFIVIVTALLLLGIRHRNALERDRQAELAASEARFHSFVDATLEGVVFIEDGRIIDINERGAALLGAAGSTMLIGRQILDFCAPADRERVAMQMRNNVTTPYEFTIRRLDGREFLGEVRGRTSLYHERPVRVTVFRDLTERRHAEAELRHEREFTSTVLDTAGSLIVVLDRAGRIVRFNRAAEEITGYRFDEVRGQSPWDYFLPPEEAAAVETVFKRLTANDIVARYENHWRMRDGAYRLFDWSNRVITDSAGQVEYIVSVGTDITERKRIEQRTQHLNRLLRTLGSVNPALVGAGSESQLFANICRTLVEQGGFAMAWVGLAEPDTKRVRVACQSGFVHGYLENLDIRYDDSPSGQGPTGMAIRTGQTVINEDTETNALFAPWRERARQHGYRSTVAIPLRIREQVLGSLNVYAAQPHAFGDEEVVLLEKLAGDVGMSVERLRAIERIAASEHELATILHNMQDTYYRTDQDGRIVRASQSATQLLGYAPQEVLGMRLGDFYVDADGRERFVAALKAAGGTLRNYEALLRHRDGRAIWVSTNAQYVRDADGKVIGIEGTTRDITERKRAEERLLDIARGVSATTGETFFHSLVAHLVPSLQADYAFVGQLVPGEADCIRTIAVQVGERRVDDFEYDLAGTPCQNVVGRETCTYPRAVQEQFPHDHMLAEMGVQAYVGTPLFDSNGAALGLLTVMYRRPIDEDPTIRTTLEIFAARAAAELERLRAEQALRESEIMLARAQEMTHLGSWRWQVATGKVTWSDEMYRIYGVSPDTGGVSFERAMSAIHPDDRALVAQQVQDMLAGKDTENYECRIVRPDGVVRYVWARSEVQRAADGSPQIVIGTVQDITGRKRAEQALRDSETRYRTIVETAQEGIWQIDTDNRTTFVNRKMAEILGYSVEEMNGRPLFDFMDDEGRALAVQNVERRKAGVAEQHEFKFRSKDGVAIWAELNTTPLYDAHGGYAGALAMVTDITERKRADQALSESEIRYRTTLEAMAEGIVLQDYQGRILTCNPAAERILGLTRDQIMGRTSLDPRWRAVHEDGTPFLGDSHPSMETLRTGEPQSNVIMGVHKPDGSLSWISINSQPLIDPGEQRPHNVVTSFHDITSLRAATAALRASEALLAHSQEVAHLGSFEWHIRSNEAIWSRATYRLFGEDPDHPSADIWTLLARAVHPDDQARMQASMNEVDEHGIREPMELRVRWPDGSEHVLWAEAEVVPGADGRPDRTVGTLQDITTRKRAEQALRDSEARFRTLSEVAFEGIFIHDQGKIVDANPTFAAMLGYELEEVKQLTVFDLVVPAQHEIVRRAMQEGYDTTLEMTALREDGSTLNVEVFGKSLIFQGRILRVVSVRDMTARLRAETQMRKLSSALEQTADSVVITNRQGIIEYVNPGFEKTTGYSRAEALGQTPRLVKSDKQGAGFYKKLWDTILAGEVFSEVFVNRRKDGSLYYEEKTITPLKDSTGAVTHFVATGKDVSERMQAQERMQHMAQHDALTELPNRMLFLDRLKQALARARWHQRLVAVLFVDLDRFKTINDTLGHEVGDRLLQALAERFTASVREGDTVARFGGDEFVMLLDDVASEKDIGVVAQKVLEALAPPFVIDGQSLYVTASIGVSLYPNDGEDSGTLLKNADIAMYRAKELGKNTYQFYSADMSARAFERLTLESSLRHAIERNEFRLYYQPQIDTASGAIVGVEALLRWQHPDFGLVAPAEFIPLLEETGLIVPAGDWVFRTACEQLCAWHAAGWPGLRMAVNLSPRQFQTPGLAIMVERGLAGVNCDPNLIELEITENVLLRHAVATVDALEAVRALGVRLAIDDFGTGYSSLSYLRRYAIDTVKIDRSFVHDIPGDPDDSAITAAIIGLAQSLKLDVIAEGVETEAQRAFLLERGCHLMQGYLFSRPLPPEDITRLLATPRAKG